MEGKYYIYQVSGQCKSETLQTQETIEEVEDRLSNQNVYGLREVSQKQFANEKNYNLSRDNPHNR